MSLKLIIKDAIGIITIDREKSLNALNKQVLKEILKTLNKFIKSNDVKVIFITGSGDKAFIAGADIKEMSKLDPKGASNFVELGQEVMNTIENSPKLIISIINGYAFGGGCEVALACHIRFASENAIFAQPEVKLGLIPGWGGTQRLPRIVGKGIANEMIISGKPIDAEEAYRVGLVNKVYKKESLMSESLKFAKNILNNGPNAISKSLSLINDSSFLRLEKGLKKEAKVFSSLFDNSETKEGLDAFLNKRKANF
jgi:enoyl-CoA hydratase